MKLRRIAVCIVAYRRTGSGSHLAPIPLRYLASEAWREKHLIRPLLRIAARNQPGWCPVSAIVHSPIVERDISVHDRAKPPYSRMVSCSVDRHDGCPGGSKQCACSCHEGDWIVPATLPGMELYHENGGL